MITDCQVNSRNRWLCLLSKKLALFLKFLTTRLFWIWPCNFLSENCTGRGTTLGAAHHHGWSKLCRRLSPACPVNQAMPTSSWQVSLLLPLLGQKLKLTCHPFYRIFTSQEGLRQNQFSMIVHCKVILFLPFFFFFLKKVFVSLLRKMPKGISILVLNSNLGPLN